VTIVLVHGTTQSPLGWDLLSAELVRDGHDVVAVDLQGLDSHAPANAYGELVIDQVPGGRCDAVVAHSGSGLLLSTISMALSARWQVYVAAVIPDGTRSFLDELRAGASQIVHEDWLGVDPTADLNAAERFLFHDCPADLLPWALRTLRPFTPLAVYDEALVPNAVPSAAIVPERDRTLRPTWMVEAARRRLAIEPVLVDAGHCPHVSRPRLVADSIGNVMSTSPASKDTQRSR